jgi:HlyD family secretion protein
MLPAYFINDEDGDAWVWAANAKGKLEKRSVTLGVYDSDLDEYEILSGLTAEDYIAFPEDSLSEGMAVTYYDESSFGGDDEYYEDDYDYEEDDSYEEGEDWDEEDQNLYEEELFEDEESTGVSQAFDAEGAVG